jgi:hypothetical protein
MFLFSQLVYGEWSNANRFNDPQTEHVDDHPNYEEVEYVHEQDNDEDEDFGDGFCEIDYPDEEYNDDDGEDEEYNEEYEDDD